MEDLKYLSGFNSELISEALDGSVPIGQNSPQKPNYGLYAEQISGSAFTVPRVKNKRSWLYRIHPSVLHGEFKSISNKEFLSSPLEFMAPPPNPMRWDPEPVTKKSSHFIEGIKTICAHGDVNQQTGCAIHIFTCNESMKDDFFYCADGHLLIVPHEGEMLFHTEFGKLKVEATEIIVIPKGIKFQVELISRSARGYICENYGAPFELPDLGPIGSNGLAAPRDFLAPQASFNSNTGDFTLICKSQGQLWKTDLNHNPIDVVGWHGNYWPYKYDLKKFNVINTVSFDHPDPSIFTVLTAPSDTPGMANLDFVIFPPRWMVAENTFRPPYFHRNLMSEFMGLIRGEYDAKTEGFLPGGFSLHNRYTAHGPDAETFEKSSHEELKPRYLGDTLAFMFESSHCFGLSEFALEGPLRQKDYQKCWKDLKSNFNVT